MKLGLFTCNACSEGSITPNLVVRCIVLSGL